MTELEFQKKTKGNFFNPFIKCKMNKADYKIHTVMVWG